ncbi:ubiquitin-protein ligase E3 [Schizosaccharomyces cryophilus OY26]|uniref:Ubiquitin-protein ligase E3 n=1 Tax=Schizosaccharomyces cryophilus (strain OY26 / ATCC MYA-4695 / CBS 11777 / NBRC 106824 / NRRL Y48691) TaxID=653667 RepID=S9VWM0_SCHCR|nr:ubiquitin-protein ligase E3 [Schizosaccharomyces cryophilus OY26]EPY50649.1 ubiquitin-protein ligase E3 [Schizosaccharomyces cryophilus OY26]
MNFIFANYTKNTTPPPLSAGSIFEEKCFRSLLLEPPHSKMESLPVVWYCHACGNEFQQPGNCTRCNSDFVEMIEPSTAPQDDPRVQNMIPIPELADPGAMLQNIFRAFGTNAQASESQPNTASGNEADNPSSEFHSEEFADTGSTANSSFPRNAAPNATGTPFVTPGIVNVGQVHNLFQTLLGPGGLNRLSRSPTSNQPSTANTHETAPHGAESAETDPAEHLTGAYVNTPLQETLPSYASSINQQPRNATSGSDQQPSINEQSQSTDEGQPNFLRSDSGLPFTAQSFVFSMGPNGTLHQVNTSGEAAQETQAGAIPIADLGSILERIFGSLNQNEGQQGEGETPFNPANIFANVFNLAGNPGDYAWGARGLDDIISQLMEQAQGHNAPPPASEEIISKLKVQSPPVDLLGEENECTICMENFKETDQVIQLPCSHFFHENCVKPWLRVNGTCAICRAPIDPSIQVNKDNSNEGSSNAQEVGEAVNHENGFQRGAHEATATEGNVHNESSTRPNAGASSSTSNYVDEEPLE